MGASRGLVGIFEGVGLAFASKSSWESTVIATTIMFVITAIVQFVGLSSTGVPVRPLHLASFRRAGHHHRLPLLSNGKQPSSVLCFECINHLRQ